MIYDDLLFFLLKIQIQKIMNASIWKKNLDACIIYVQYGMSSLKNVGSFLTSLVFEIAHIYGC